MSDFKLQLLGFLLAIFVVVGSILYGLHEVKRIENIQQKEFRILHFKHPDCELR